jgi:hypothetical protein
MLVKGGTYHIEESPSDSGAVTQHILEPDSGSTWVSTLKTFLLRLLWLRLNKLECSSSGKYCFIQAGLIFESMNKNLPMEWVTLRILHKGRVTDASLYGKVLSYSRILD